MAEYTNEDGNGGGLMGPYVPLVDYVDATACRNRQACRRACRTRAARHLLEQRKSSSTALSKINWIFHSNIGRRPRPIA